MSTKTHHLCPTPQEVDTGLSPLPPTPPLPLSTLPPQPPIDLPLGFSPNFLDFQYLSTNFLEDMDFGAEFNFGGDFNFLADDSNDTIGAGSYEYDGVLCDYSGKGSVCF